MIPDGGKFRNYIITQCKIMNQWNLLPQDMPMVEVALKGIGCSMEEYIQCYESLCYMLLSGFKARGEGQRWVSRKASPLASGLSRGIWLTAVKTRLLD